MITPQTGPRMAPAMRIDVYHHFPESEPHGGPHYLDQRLDTLFNTLQSIKGILMTTHAEFIAQLNALGDQLDKTKTEIVDAVADLEAKLAAAGQDTIPDDVLAAFGNVKSKVQALDDLNADVTTTTTVPLEGAVITGAVDPTAPPAATETHPDAETTGTSAITKSAA